MRHFNQHGRTLMFLLSILVLSVVNGFAQNPDSTKNTAKPTIFKKAQVVRDEYGNILEINNQPVYGSIVEWKNSLYQADIAEKISNTSVGTNSKSVSAFEKQIIVAIFDGFVAAGVIREGESEITSWTVLSWITGAQRVQQLSGGRLLVQTYSGFQILTINPTTFKLTSSKIFGTGGLSSLTAVGNQRLFGFNGNEMPVFDAKLSGDYNSYTQYATDVVTGLGVSAAKVHQNGKDLVVFDYITKQLYTYVDAANRGTAWLSPPQSEPFPRGVTDITADGKILYSGAYYTPPSDPNCECPGNEEPAALYTVDPGGRIRFLPVVGLPRYSSSVELTPDRTGVLLVATEQSYGYEPNPKSELKVFNLDGSGQKTILRSPFSFSYIRGAIYLQ